MKVKRFDSKEKNVWKYVFRFEGAISEAVLYKYNTFEERTVLCISVQSGCPVGCLFCGTGKQFIRNLTWQEITQQADYCFADMEIKTEQVKKLQIMFMSMGEPMLNIDNVEESIFQLNAKYRNAKLLLSTVGIKSKKGIADLMYLGEAIKETGLQFSIHEANEKRRNIIIPFINKMSLREIRSVGIEWNVITKRPVYLNYIVHNYNAWPDDIERLMDIYPPEIFYFTLSVLCETDKDKKKKDYTDNINTMSETLISNGYNVKIFNPAGQDDIGGGCGQLWYVQDYLKKLKGNK